MNELAQCDSGPMQVEPPKIRQKIEAKIERLEEDLTKAKAALSLLDQNQGFEQVHDALTKARIY